MIRVTCITGEGFDLNLGKDVLPGILLSNGKREVLVHLSQEEVRKVVELYVDLMQKEVDPIEQKILSSASTEPVLNPIQAKKPAVVAPKLPTYSDPTTGTESV
jgi:hypothetical protein